MRSDFLVLFSHEFFNPPASGQPFAFPKRLRRFAMSRLIRAFTDLRARNNAGEDVDFGAFADKVVLVVNVARH